MIEITISSKDKFYISAELLIYIVYNNYISLIVINTIY